MARANIRVVTYTSGLQESEGPGSLREKQVLKPQYHRKLLEQETEGSCLPHHHTGRHFPNFREVNLVRRERGRATAKLNSLAVGEAGQGLVQQETTRNQ